MRTPSESIFNRALCEFGQRVGAGNVGFNESGVTRLMLDGKFGIDIEHDPKNDCLHLYWTPEPPAGALSLLEGNYLMHRESGARFLYDSAAEEYVLHDVVQLEKVETGMLDESLQAFAKLVIYWEAKFRELPTNVPIMDFQSGLSV